MADFKWTHRQELEDVTAATVKRAAAETMAHAVAICPQDTGTLARSITMQQVGPSHWRVGTPVHYAPHVEFGTVKMAAQPFLGPALEAARRKYG